MNEYIKINIENNNSGTQNENPTFGNILKNKANDENEIKLDADILDRKPVKNILLVDDEEPVRKLFKEALEKFGYKVMLATNGNEGLKHFRDNPVDLILTDIFMPEKDGHTFIQEIIREFPTAKIFAITGKKTFYGIDLELDIAETLGALKGFTKPVKLTELLSAIKEL